MFEKGTAHVWKKGDFLGNCIRNMAHQNNTNASIMNDLQNQGESQKPGKGSFGLPRLREKVINALSEAFVANNLDEHDYETRLQAAHNAKSIDDLSLVVHDFPNRDQLIERRAQRQQAVPPPRRHFQHARPAHSYNAYETKDLRFSLIGDCKISLRELRFNDIQLYNLIGDTVIDLTEVEDGHETIEAEVYNAIGDTKIYVPAGTNVINSCITVIGEYKERHKGDSVWSWLNGKNKSQLPPPEPRDITVVLRGFKLIGDIKVVYY
ncbi:LiaF-related protein [Flammeovirgaceae bacterium SG7u.111]|nr:LiaF-related protein [Flammeovirgaceae bacterium SG7u.132]WPO38147.1 LiaF-related protein [Flammeovirgaceae bacterium SG7u.111]